MPVVGNGSDARPFLVGMTTKALLRNAVRDPGTFVLHLDATFKLNSVGYPVLVYGITDASRSFHLLALFITSQLQEGNYSAAHLALRCIYARVNGMEMRVTYVLGDADKAQYNAFRCVFADSQFTYLMCFYHVVAKLRERSRGLSSELVALVFRGMYDLHFSQNEAEFCERKERMLALWDEHMDLATFSIYEKAQWLQGNFKNWQCYCTPTGCPTTTNPVEQFNRALKRDYTHHHQLKMGLLLACCGHRSMAFRDSCSVPPALRP